jgi:hypothetical protein
LVGGGWDLLASFCAATGCFYPWQRGFK